MLNPTLKQALFALSMVTAIAGFSAAPALADPTATGDLGDIEFLNPGDSTTTPPDPGTIVRVPEPGTMLGLAVTGLAAIATKRRRG